MKRSVILSLGNELSELRHHELRCAACEEIVNGDRASYGGAGGRFLGRAADVRCYDNILHGKERVVQIEGLLLDCVEACACDLLLLQSADESGLIDDSASCSVDQICGLLHEVELAVADAVNGGRKRRHVQGYIISLLEDLIAVFDQLDVLGNVLREGIYAITSMLNPKCAF